MRAHYGAPADVVQVVERDTPVPGAGEVLVRVAAAGLNSADWRMTRADPPFMRLVFGLSKPRDERLGMDVAGTVEQVGAGVTSLAVGDRVFGEVGGAFAEFVVAPASRLALVPQGVDLTDAAALALSGVTALQAIDLGGVTDGSRVLVIGASGGVGTYCVQLAAARGARVTAVCSTKNIDHVTAAGAERAIDYTRDSITGTYDVIIELAVVAPLREMRRFLAPRGTLVLSSGDGGFFGPLPRILASAVTPGAKMLAASATPARLAEVGERAAAGDIRPVITARFGLDEAADAIAHVDGGHARGKAIIQVAAR